jgi:peptidoglycan/LPS O-acetylase OafA/YrhL
VINAVVAGSGPGWLEWEPLRKVGRVSYGLYLWHHVVLIFSDRALGLEEDWVATALVVVPTSAVLTWLSWRYVEQPWLRSDARRELRQGATVSA